MKIYGEQKSVDHLNITVNQGEIYGLLGRNGEGKTTTIRMLLGLIKPTFGQVEIFGENLFNNQKSILRRIGSIVEVPGFYENLTARENLLINATILGVYKKNNLRRIGYSIEVPGFYENLTARENILTNAKILGVHKKNTIEEALEIVDLHNETKKLVGKYSLGMKQRLGIARALLHNPELL